MGDVPHVPNALCELQVDMKAVESFTMINAPIKLFPGGGSQGIFLRPGEDRGGFRGASHCFFRRALLLGYQRHHGPLRVLGVVKHGRPSTSTLCRLFGRWRSQEGDIGSDHGQAWYHYPANSGIRTLGVPDGRPEGLRFGPDGGIRGLSRQCWLARFSWG